MKNLIKLFFIIVLFIPFFTYSQSDPAMILVKGGSFSMGNPYTDAAKKGDADEKPVHQVKVNDFYIGKYEVSVKEYKDFINDNTFTEFASLRSHKMPATPDTTWMSEHSDTKKHYESTLLKWWGWIDEFPMQYLTWYDAVAYCNWLSSKKGLNKCYTYNETTKSVTCDFTQNGYRLPTESEWEFAAAGGTLTKGYRFSGSNNSADVVWYDETTSYKGPQKIGTKAANELGIYDMTGNVWEWCYDYYSPFYYNNSTKENPINETATGYKVIRGGAWHYRLEYATVYTRDGPEPSYTNYNYGFRLAKNAN